MRRYTFFKVTSIDELDARTSSCNDSETALTNPIEYMYPLKWLRSLFITDQTLTFRSRFYARWLTQSNLNSVLWHVLVFFKIPAPKRERVAENEMITLAGENEISWCIVIAVNVCNTRGHPASCKMQR